MVNLTTWGMLRCPTLTAPTVCFRKWRSVGMRSSMSGRRPTQPTTRNRKRIQTTSTTSSDAWGVSRPSETGESSRLTHLVVRVGWTYLVVLVWWTHIQNCCCPANLVYYLWWSMVMCDHHWSCAMVCDLGWWSMICVMVYDLGRWSMILCVGPSHKSLLLLSLHPHPEIIS